MKGFLKLALTSVCVFAGAYAVAGSTSVEELMQRHLRMKPEQVQAVMKEPIPAHAKREIEMGFADEDFVRLMMAINNATRGTDFPEKSRLANSNPLSKAYARYECASLGAHAYIMKRGWSVGRDCMYYWTYFLNKGPEVPFDLDFPLAMDVTPWDKPDQDTIDHKRKLNRDFLSKSELPAFIQLEIVELKVDYLWANAAFGQTREHPREEFLDELDRIEKQPAEARRYGRLLCTRGIPSLVEYARTPWHRQCFAYWHRYIEHQGAD